MSAPKHENGTEKTKRRKIIVAMDGSEQADAAFKCKRFFVMF